jgi:hypothetical protein
MANCDAGGAPLGCHYMVFIQGSNVVATTISGFDRTISTKSTASLPFSACWDVRLEIPRLVAAHPEITGIEYRRGDYHYDDEADVFNIIADTLASTPRLTLFVAYAVLDVHLLHLAYQRILPIPHLRSFDWSSTGGEGLQDSPIDVIANHPNLRHLTIRPFPEVTEAQLAQIVRCNTKLVALSLDDSESGVWWFRETDVLVTALRSNWTLQVLECPIRCQHMLGAPHSLTPTCAKYLRRNRQCSWRNQHRHLLGYCLALRPLRLSSFLILEILSWTVDLPGLDLLKRLRLIDRVARALSR